MKKKIFWFVILSLSLLVFGCNNEPYFPYSYSVVNEIPDSLRGVQRKWVLSAIEQTTKQHLSAGDYEDPEDIISEAVASSYTLFAYPIEGLTKSSCNGCITIFIPYNQLKGKQLHIFDSLRYK